MTKEYPYAWQEPEPYSDVEFRVVATAEHPLPAPRGDGLLRVTSRTATSSRGQSRFVALEKFEGGSQRGPTFTLPGDPETFRFLTNHFRRLERAARAALEREGWDATSEALADLRVLARAS